MYTRGRKKDDAEPLPPARDPRDVEMIEMLRQRIQELELQQLRPDLPVEEAKAEPTSGTMSQWTSILLAEENIGKVHPNDFIDWLSTVERVFDVWDIPEKLKAKLVAIKLRQHASLWLKNKLRQRVKVPLVISPHLPEPLPYTTPKTAPKATTPTTLVASNTRERVDNAPRCYTCSRLGHYARDCPNLKTLAFVLDDACPIYDTDAEPELDEPGDELVYPDREEALVIHRVLNFFIGKSYKDEVWCEVIPMDAAHILLGRPWKFDRKTKHDGFQNTYIFKKDGVNITLVPFDSRQTQAKGSNLFMKKTGFEGLMKTSPYVFTLAVVEENEIISEAPLQVQPFLREFADVIPGDIPLGLQAMRNIQHYIDFILGFAIPNRPAYRMNPKEFAELQRQVTELLEKGLIRKNMSPCVVPALLVPNMVGLFSSLEQHLSYLRKIFSVLRAQKLYANGKKCHFLMTEVTFLGYIVTDSGIKIDPTKVENFGSIIAPLTECMKGGRFTWTSETANAFDILKAKVTEAPVLALPNFDEVFQVECDTSGVGIGGLLSQYQRPIALFSEKLNDARRKYSTYDKDLYAIVRSLDTRRHYLLSNEFVLFSDHEALKFINGQHKLKPHHAKWVEFIQAFSFVIRHKVGSNNQFADALSRRHSLITTMQIRVQDFDSFVGFIAMTLILGSITIWEDLTTRFLAQLFPSRRIAKLRNDILMFQQHHEESLSEAWTRFKELLQKSLIMSSTFGSKFKFFMTMLILSQDEPLTNRAVVSFVTEMLKNHGH
nr:reverse transcriptase domain-containing protein [Tanacetum cinerariifolium]